MAEQCAASCCVSDWVSKLREKEYQRLYKMRFTLCPACDKPYRDRYAALACQRSHYREGTA